MLHHDERHTIVQSLWSVASDADHSVEEEEIMKTYSVKVLGTPNTT
jgi:hypothetical protein